MADGKQPRTDGGQTGEFTLQNEPGEHADVFRDGNRVARYVYAYDPTAEGTHDTAKPFIHVTDPATGNPITKGSGGTYTHHRGIFIGWNQTRVGGETYDFWHMNDSNIVHEAFESLEEFPETGTLSARTRWITEDDETVLTETREQAFRAPPTEEGIVAVDFTSTLTPADGPIDLHGDPEHAGVQYRAHDAVAENESAEYVFPEGAFEEATPDNETINSREGLPWVAMTYRIGDRSYLVQAMDHPENPPGTTFSAYRPYGRFGAFFEETLSPDDSLTARYQFLVRRGSEYSREDLDDWYAAFAEQ